MNQLNNYVEILLGGTPATNRPEFWDGSIPWVSIVDFLDSKKIFETEKTITEEGLRLSNTKLLNEGDIIVSARGTVGKVAVCGTRMTFNQSCYALFTKDPKTLSQNYLFYLLQEKIRYLRQMAVGGVFNTIIKSTLEKIPVDLPNIKSQEEIASTLSSYDDLIDNNRKRIQLLEESARILFREWFVYFKFPNHEKVKIVDGVPEGWEKEPIKKYFDTTSGGTPSREYSEYYQGDINWVKTQELDEKYIFDTEEKITQEAISKSSAKIFPAYTLLVSIYGNTNIGRTGILAKPAASNQACVAFFPKKQYYHYIYLQQYLQMIRNYLVGLSQGAAQTNISQDTLRKVNILIPDELLMNKFLEIAEPIYEQINNLQYRNKKLAQARDLLLPRLMSGKIDVSKLNIRVAQEAET